MNGNIEREILGDWVDKGYSLKEYDDHVVTVVYKDKELKDKELAAYPQTVATTTPAVLRSVYQRHEARLREAVEVTP